ncbi:MAG: 30S ribosomal protein S16 [Proteobacteria bacterium]|nr:30S ribosomal protein S16 [Pseudomonadota bacterium]
MAVKIRLTRLGKKKQPTYRVVVMDSRKQRDGKYIEQLGIYDPKQEPSLVKIDNERALYWLNTGAQPTERAQKLLEISGAWTQFRVARGDIHTVGGDAPDAEAKATKEEPKVETTTATEEVAEAIVEDVAAEAAADESPTDNSADSSDES